MTKISFDKYLFRCSSLGKLMTYPDKDTLSAGPKTFLGQIFKEEFYQKTSQIQSRYLDKGLMVEEEAIALYSKVCDKKFVKNDKRFDNDHITGEPDILSDDLIDIKCSWNHTTFPLTTDTIPNKDYYWQLQGYMELTGKNLSKLVYCLVDTPDELVYTEIKKITAQLGMIDLPEELEQEIWDSHRLEGIDPKFRVKEFVVERNQKDIDAIYKRVGLARDYLNNLTQVLI